MRTRIARITAMFGIVAAIAAGLAPTLATDATPDTTAIYCPKGGCPAN